MPVETGETLVRDANADFDNLAAMHELQRALHDLDSLRREEILGMVSKIRVEPWFAPPGEAVIIRPDGMSREIPLEVEVFDPEDEDWHKISSSSEAYEEVVKYYRVFDPYFVGKSVEPDSDGQIYVYSEDRNTRVQAAPDSRFSRYYVAEE